MNLANVYSAEGDSKKALETHLLAFSIFEKTAEPTNQPLIMSLANIATINSALGDFENANRVQAKLESAVESVIAFNLAIGSERQKLAFLDSVAGRPRPTNFSHIPFMARKPPAPASWAPPLSPPPGSPPPPP